MRGRREKGMIMVGILYCLSLMCEGNNIFGVEFMYVRVGNGRNRKISKS